MPETMKLTLPLLSPAQAQKHVTVNESLTRLDGLVQLALSSIDAIVPPISPDEGEVHSVGAGATADWAGQDGRLAIFVNGGWVYLTPAAGWQGWSIPAGTRVQYDGAAWVAGAGALSANGAGFVHRSVELDHAVSGGATSVVTGMIPDGAVVYGITGRVLTAIGGASAFEVGVSGATDRYGSGIGTGAGAWLRGITGSPLSYYAATDLVLTATGGDFDGTGSVRLAVHYAELTLPRA